MHHRVKLTGLYFTDLFLEPFLNKGIMFASLGVVHNCQHLCIRTERTEGGGGHDASVLFLIVYILLMLPPGGYD